MLGSTPPTINGVSGSDFQFQTSAPATIVEAQPAIGLVKLTNGTNNDAPPGLFLLVGSQAPSPTS
jgi:hypothetical protein